MLTHADLAQLYYAKTDAEMAKFLAKLERMDEHRRLAALRQTMDGYTVAELATRTSTAWQITGVLFNYHPLAVTDLLLSSAYRSAPLADSLVLKGDRPRALAMLLFQTPPDREAFMHRRAIAHAFKKVGLNREAVLAFDPEQYSNIPTLLARLTPKQPSSPRPS